MNFSCQHEFQLPIRWNQSKKKEDDISKMMSNAFSIRPEHPIWNGQIGFFFPPIFSIFSKILKKVCLHLPSASELKSKLRIELEIRFIPDQISAVRFERSFISFYSMSIFVLLWIFVVVGLCLPPPSPFFELILWEFEDL